VIVQVYDNNVEKALRVFKRNCQKSGLTKDMRRKRFYEKPSDRRKRKQNAALRRKR
jgi:small subunit ribosomal protein S21